MLRLVAGDQVTTGEDGGEVGVRVGVASDVTVDGVGGQAAAVVEFVGHRRSPSVRVRAKVARAAASEDFTAPVAMSRIRAISSIERSSR